MDMKLDFIKLFLATTTLTTSCITPLFAQTDIESDEYAFLSQTAFSPAQMEQSVLDAPGAVTIVSAKQISDLGLKTLADVIRLVPGFSTTQGPFFGINRGPNYPTARRLQVLVDGVSEVNPLVGIVRYENLPVAIENIERIEVIRSQSSATYGANAFYGAINIVTKNPYDVVGTGLYGYSTSSGNEWAGYARQSNVVGNTGLSLEYRQSFFDHYDTYEDSDAKRHDDQKSQFAKIRSLTRTSSGDTLDLAVAGTIVTTEHDLGQSAYGLDYPVASMDTLLTSMNYTTTTQNHIISLTGSANDKDWDYRWPTCAPKAFYYPELGELYRDNSALVNAMLGGGSIPSATLDELIRAYEISNAISNDPESFTEVCGETAIEYHHRTYIGGISDIWQASEDVRVSSYLQMDYRWMESTTYGNGKTTLKKSKFFTNAEFKPSDNATINGGVFVESLGHEFSNPQFSPRVSFTFHFDHRNAVKVVHSQGKRLIDGIEVIDYNQVPTYFSEAVYGSNTQSAFITYFPLYQDEDHVETITSTEVNYYYVAQNFELEARYFVEALKDILNYQDLANIPITDFDRDGIDLALKARVSELTIGGSVFYLNSDSSEEADYNDYEFTGGSIYVIKPFSRGILLSAGYYATSPIAFATGETLANSSRFDIRLAKSMGPVELEAMVRQHHDDYNYGEYTAGQPDSGKRGDATELLIGINAKL
jgi:iron complex outermembrane receptor protein